MKVSMSAVWDRTSDFLSDNKAAIIGIAAFTIFLPGLIGEVLAPVKATSDVGLKLGLGIVSLVLGLLSLWGQLTITALVVDRVVNSAGARAHAARRLGAMILVALAMLAAAALIALPIVGVLIANGVDVSRLNQPDAIETLTPGAAIFVLIYGLLLCPLYLWLAARFVVLAAPVVVAEHLALGALGRAFRLTRGLGWRIVGVLLLYVIVMYVAMLAATAVFGSIFALIFKPASAISIASVLTAVVKALVSTIFSVIGTVFPAELYLAAQDREAVATA